MALTIRSWFWPRFCPRKFGFVNVSYLINCHWMNCIFAFSPQSKFICEQGSIYSLFLYDAVYLYMTMMDKIVSEKLNWRNGTFWLNMARNWVTYG